MDFGTIDRRLNADEPYYTNPHDFIADVRTIFRNCFVYNQAGTFVWRLAEILSKKFEEQLHSFVTIPHSTGH